MGFEEASEELVSELAEKGEADYDCCGGAGDAPREWKRKPSDGRVPFDETNPQPGPQRVLQLFL